MSLTAWSLLLPALLAAGPIDEPSAELLAEPLVEPSSEQTFERHPVHEGKRFLCLGAGIRKKSFFRVYAIDFCVEAEAGKAELARWLAGPGQRHAASSAEELAGLLAEDPEFFRFVLSMPVEKRADIVFVRSVSVERLRDAFAWSLAQVLGEEERPRIERFVANLDRAMREGDRMVLHTKPNGEVTVQLSSSHLLKDERVADALWQNYLGPQSVTPALKASVAEGAVRYAAR